MAPSRNACSADDTHQSENSISILGNMIKPSAEGPVNTDQDRRAMWTAFSGLGVKPIADGSRFTEEDVENRLEPGKSMVLLN